MIVETPLGRFPSARAAARAHGVSLNAVYKALSRGNIDKLGTGKHRFPAGAQLRRPFEIAGYTFTSKAECARITGLPYHRFSTLRPSHLRRRHPEVQLKLKLELIRDVTQALKGNPKCFGKQKTPRPSE